MWNAQSHLQYIKKEEPEKMTPGKKIWEEKNISMWREISFSSLWTSATTLRQNPENIFINYLSIEKYNIYNLFKVCH